LNGQRLQCNLLPSTTSTSADYDHDDAIEPTKEFAVDCKFSEVKSPTPQSHSARESLADLHLLLITIAHVDAAAGPLAPFGTPVLNPFFERRGMCLRCRIRPVPVTFLRLAFSPQLSALLSVIVLEYLCHLLKYQVHRIVRATYICGC
jgi:hypothetical protein